MNVALHNGACFYRKNNTQSTICMYMFRIPYIGGFFFTERRAFSSVYKILACEIVFFVDTMLSRDRQLAPFVRPTLK